MVKSAMISMADFEANASDYDRTVCSTPGVDLFCSSSLWTIPSYRALAPGRTPYIIRSEDGYLVLCVTTELSGRRIFQPLEAAWCLASPLLATNPERWVPEAARLIIDELRAGDVLLVPGLPSDSPILLNFARALQGNFALRWGPSTVRHVVDLSSGREAFLDRRSRNFRRSLRRAQRTAESEGLSYIDICEGVPGELYARILAIEAKSWKGLEGSGLVDGPMRELYRHIIERLVEAKALRLTFAQLEERDVGFILGGVFAGTYRGLQFSYRADLANRGIGNLLQFHTLGQAERNGIEYYDLGTDVPYKQRWSDFQRETSLLAAFRV